MADKIFPSGNYLIIAKDGEEQLEWPKTNTFVVEGDDRFSIILGDNEDRVTILFTDAADWDLENDTDYTEATLRTMLRENTAQ